MPTNAVGTVGADVGLVGTDVGSVGIDVGPVGAEVGSGAPDVGSGSADTLYPIPSYTYLYVLIPTHTYLYGCLLYTSPSPRDLSTSRMPSSA